MIWPSPSANRLTPWWPLRVGIRNGDSSSSERSKQLRSPPQILVTTPESLTLLLSNPKAEELFSALDTVILDEWHELMGSKRGSQTELCLSWLRQHPRLQTWAISATIGNLEQAARHALGTSGDPLIVGGAPARSTQIQSILPESIDGFPWAGHLGLRMYEELVAQLSPGVSTLLFTNTRNQSERWHQCLRFACPEMEDALALHHSAIDRSEREAIEAAVKAGEIRWVVCTSSWIWGWISNRWNRWCRSGSRTWHGCWAGRSAHRPAAPLRCCSCPPMLWNCWN